MHIDDEALRDIVDNLEDYYLHKEADERRLYLSYALESLEEEQHHHYLSSTGWMIQRIIEINREDEGTPSEVRKPIKLYINCPGGDQTEGLALISVIFRSKTPIWTINMGSWGSMAFLIGISGIKRFSMPYSVFLMHEGIWSAEGATNKVIDKARFQEKIEESFIKPLVVEQSKMSEEEYDNAKRKEFFLTAEEALEWGFIDEIVDSLDDIL